MSVGAGGAWPRCVLLATLLGPARLDPRGPAVPRDGRVRPRVPGRGSGVRASGGCTTRRRVAGACSSTCPATWSTAAQGQCEDLPYIVPRHLRRRRTGRRAAPCASRPRRRNYDPVYYWVVGTAGEPFYGRPLALRHARMARRCCAPLVLALAAWCLTTWVRGSWAFIGLLVGLTPDAHLLDHRRRAQRPGDGGRGLPVGRAARPRRCRRGRRRAPERRERWSAGRRDPGRRPAGGTPGARSAVGAADPGVRRGAPRAARRSSPSRGRHRVQVAARRACSPWRPASRCSLEPRQRHGLPRGLNGDSRRQLGPGRPLADWILRQHRRVPLPRPAGAARGPPARRCSCW